ncbi:hypothetical protein PAECIP111802_03845 [Paenibacillus allorhizosphaerae]|uniref:Uncharacterized protein n=1 Tax=Paenibacillus allorhizosphaerae TaxID=2849866 RepID=A0ABM8VKD8_9BACL|nr:hypothetical protein PAECIP111802_03845 [Paenibacillus allorhizosphaerae]
MPESLYNIPGRIVVIFAAASSPLPAPRIVRFKMDLLYWELYFPMNLMIKEVPPFYVRHGIYSYKVV